MINLETVNKLLNENNLKRDTYKLIVNMDTIKELGIKHGNILNRTSLINMLKTLKEKYHVPERTSISLLGHYLQNVLQLFTEIEIYSEKKGEKVTRYISTYTEVSPYEIALSLLSNSFLSHYSALYVHDLTINNPKDIYINREQSKKPVNKDNAKLTQRKVDYAFSKDMRRTTDIYNFVYQGTHYTVHVLNSKHTNKTGIIREKPVGFSKTIQVTNVERTLLDATIRPRYSGGSLEVLEAYHTAKPFISIQKIADYLKKFDYIYPYEKSILFYLQNSNYSKNEIAIFKDIVDRSPNKSINFYLDYQLTQKREDKQIGIFYPSAIDDIKIEYFDIDSAYVKIRKNNHSAIYEIESIHLYNKEGEGIVELKVFSPVDIYDNYQEVVFDVSKKYHVSKDKITIAEINE